MAVFVLVPGGYGGSWIWRPIRNSLWQAGHEVYTPSLTGMGERVHLANPEVDLSVHIQDVVNEITFSDLKEVNLVGYSYAGMVITGVAEKIPERIAQLIYLDAWVPEDGQSAADLIGTEAAELTMQVVQAYGDGWKLIPTNLEEYPRMTPQPIKTGFEKLSLKNPAAARLPKAFVSFTEDSAEDLMLIPILRFAEQVKNDPDWRYLEVHGDHLVTLTEPEKIVQVLLELVPVKV